MSRSDLAATRDEADVEVDDGLIVRLNPDDDTVVGITIIDFYQRFAEHPGVILSYPVKPDCP